MKKFLAISALYVYTFCTSQEIKVTCDQLVAIKLDTEQSVITGSGGWALRQIKSGSLLLFPNEIEAPVRLTISTKFFNYEYFIEDLNFKQIVICHPNTLEIDENNDCKKVLFSRGWPNQNIWQPIKKETCS